MGGNNHHYVKIIDKKFGGKEYFLYFCADITETYTQ